MDDNHFENIIRIREFLVDKQFKKLLTAKDRGEWITEPITANAYYDPEQNTISKFINLNEISLRLFVLQCFQLAFYALLSSAISSQSEIS